jgi:predicted phage terminase large subunit-like protein
MPEGRQEDFDRAMAFAGLHVMARESLAWFAFACLRDERQRRFDIEAYQMEWCRTAEALVRGELKQVVITAPRGHAKSTWWSVALPAWFLGCDPNATVMCVGNTIDIVAPFSKAVRGVVDTSPEFKTLFPGVALDRELGDAVAHWYLMGQAPGAKDPNYVCAGIGGAAVGKRASLIIVDDPIKLPQQVATEAQRDAMEQWFWQVLYPCRRNADTPVVVIGTRYHEDDLLGRLIERPDWHSVEFPAISQDAETGEDRALWPAKFPLQELYRLRDPATGMGSREFSCVYMCRPMPAGGGIIKAEWAERRWPRDVPEPLLWAAVGEDEQYREAGDQAVEQARRDGRPVVEMVVQAWDVAETPSLSSDFSACATVGMDEHGRKFVLDAWWGRETAPQLEQRMVSLYQRWRPIEVVVEKASSGNALLQSIDEAHPDMPFRGVAPGGSNKAMRLESVARQFEAGQVFVPETGREMPTSKRAARGARPWPDALISLLVGYPGVEIDDPIDVLVYALRRLDWIRQREPRVLA